MFALISGTVLVFFFYRPVIDALREDVTYLSNQTGVSIPLTNVFNLYHIGFISIGFPGREFVVLLDTGSTLSWIRDSNCRVNLPFLYLNCQGQRKYSRRDSRTDSRLTQRFRIHYDDGGEVSGPMFRDRIQVGTFPSIQNFVHFGSAIQLDADTNLRPYDGIIGLGFESGIRRENVIISIVKELNFPLFVYYLLKASNAPNSIENSAGQISHFILFNSSVTFGWMSQNCGKTALFVPLIASKDWRFQSREVWANGLRVDGIARISCDTGTSALLVPRRIYGQLMKAWGLSPNSEAIPLVDCSKKLQMRFKLDNLDYLKFTEKHLLLHYGNVCALQVAPVEGDLWLFGAPTYRAYCNIFDVQKRRIGFAELN